MQPRFASPRWKDRHFERTQPDVLKRAEFVLDEALFTTSLLNGFLLCVGMIGVAALIGILA